MDGWMDGRGVSQYPRFFFEKRGDNNINLLSPEFTESMVKIKLCNQFVFVSIFSGT